MGLRDHESIRCGLGQTGLLCRSARMAHTVYPGCLACDSEEPVGAVKGGEKSGRVAEQKCTT